VTITLTATEPSTASHSHTAAARRRRPSSRSVVVGSQTVRLAAGDRRTVTISLNRTGTRLLAGAHRLRTMLTASSLYRTLETTSITFTSVARDSTKSSKSKSSGTTHHKTSRKRRPSTHRTAKRTQGAGGSHP
jgi:hypothetical protein